MPGKLVALALSTHPGPALAVTAVAVVLGFSVGLEPPRALILGVAFLLDQASVGLSNDLLDADRDRAVGRRDKPVAMGWITESMARNAALVSAGLAVALTIPLGLAATVAHIVFMASAWAYNLGLKGTLVSVLPYIVSFGLLPTVVTLARPVPVLAAPWAMGMGALLGVAAHLANAIPDLRDDARTGVRGLPHRLGVRGSATMTCLALVGAATLAIVGPAEGASGLQWVGFVATLAIAATGMTLATIRPPSRLLFQLIILATLINVALLATSGQRLLV